MNGLVRKHSRLIYDIYTLLPLVTLNNVFNNLVAEVRVIRRKSPRYSSAQNGVNIPGMLHAIVEKKIYRADYLEIVEKILEERVPYKVVIETLEEVAREWHTCHIGCICHVCGRLEQYIAFYFG